MSDDFALWDVLISMLWFGLLMSWFWMIVVILGDIFRDPDMGGGSKALWAAFIVLVPWLGALCYVFARGGSMSERRQRSAFDRQTAMEPYAGAGAEPTVADELRELTQLRDDGVLTSVEFEAAKAKVLT
jgi:hypothetical protein